MNLEDRQHNLNESLLSQESALSNKSDVPQDNQESCIRRLPVIGPSIKLYDRYDGTFLTVLAMQYFNQGSKVLVYLATADLFKTFYKLEPGQV